MTEPSAARPLQLLLVKGEPAAELRFGCVDGDPEKRSPTWPR